MLTPIKMFKIDLYIKKTINFITTFLKTIKIQNLEFTQFLKLQVCRQSTFFFKKAL